MTPSRGRRMVTWVRRLLLEMPSDGFCGTWLVLEAELAAPLPAYPIGNAIPTMPCPARFFSSVDEVTRPLSTGSNPRL